MNSHMHDRIGHKRVSDFIQIGRAVTGWRLWLECHLQQERTLGSRCCDLEFCAKSYSLKI